MNTRYRPIPLRAIPMALAALAVPSAGAMFAPEWLEDEAGILLWLTPILPAFLLAYYRGWRGAALSLAFGMASLALANVALVIFDVAPPDWRRMMAMVVVYLIITQGLAALTEVLNREREAVERLARTDQLTGLANRREAEAVLLRGFEAALRGEALAVVLFDLDRFKAVNDRFGHAAGDEALRAMGTVLRAETRAMDLSARFGGEEFLSILFQAQQGRAVAFANRVREALAREELPCGAVTVSAGVAEFAPAMGSPDLLLAAADRALFSAKEQGRDRVVAWEALGAPPGDEPARASPTRRRLGVLVVDDDLAVERGVAEFLELRGFEAWAAGGSRGALRRFAEDGGDVDVLLTDVIMPEMSGPTLVDRLNRSGWHPRVVYMSGYLRGQVATALLPGGRAEFVEKPLDLDALARLLRAPAGAATEGGAHGRC